MRIGVRFDAGGVRTLSNQRESSDDQENAVKRKSRAIGPMQSERISFQSGAGAGSLFFGQADQIARDRLDLILRDRSLVNVDHLAHFLVPFFRRQGGLNQHHRGRMTGAAIGIDGVHPIACRIFRIEILRQGHADTAQLRI